MNYEIRYRTGNGLWNEKNAAIIWHSLKGLIRKKTYSDQVRAFKDIGGITYSGQSSDVKRQNKYNRID